MLRNVGGTLRKSRPNSTYRTGHEAQQTGGFLQNAAGKSECLRIGGPLLDCRLHMCLPSVLPCCSLSLTLTFPYPVLLPYNPFHEPLVTHIHVELSFDWTVHWGTIAERKSIW